MTSLPSNLGFVIVPLLDAGPLMLQVRDSTRTNSTDMRVMDACVARVGIDMGAYLRFPEDRGGKSLREHKRIAATQHNKKNTTTTESRYHPEYVATEIFSFLQPQKQPLREKASRVFQR